MSPAAGLLVLMALLGLFAPWLSPQDPQDLAAFRLEDAFAAPFTADIASGAVYWLGADAQGRDMLSAILHGLRVSLIVATAAVAIAAVVGIAVGLAAGLCGGWLDAVLMRLADLQLALPAILTAMLIYGVARAALSSDTRDELGLMVVIAAIALSEWVLFARTTRALIRIEKQKAYVDAARAIGVGTPRLVFVHLLPNIAHPLLVIATAAFALAVTTEATLSFLGVGVPPATPSLGTLIRNGQQYLFSGEWWLLAMPAAALVILTLCLHWLADGLGPRAAGTS